MTEGNTAIHATPSLLLQVFDALWFVDFMPVFDAYINWTTLWSFARRG
jgi:hypothetical protein